jgi:hypothetical protein
MSFFFTLRLSFKEQKFWFTKGISVSSSEHLKNIHTKKKRNKIRNTLKEFASELE